MMSDETANFGLTPSERRIARLLVTDAPYREIAQRLGYVDNDSLRPRCCAIFKKLGARNREHLVSILLLPLDSPLRPGLLDRDVVFDSSLKPVKPLPSERIQMADAAIETVRKFLTQR